MLKTNHKLEDYWSTLLHCGDDMAITRRIQVFRKQLFIDHMKWDLTTENNLEIDEFDLPTTIYCGIFCRDCIVASWRAIRADRPYLAKTKFPQLAVNRHYPETRDYWEISRFGVLSPEVHKLAVDLSFAQMFAFGSRINARAFIAMTDLRYERYLRSKSIRTRRYGPPQTVGSDMRGRNVIAVSGEIPLKLDVNPHIQTFITLGTRIKCNDRTLADRPQRISA